MTPPSVSALEFDSFSTATGSSLITGALSVVAPFLAALTAALVALAVAGWVALLRQRRSQGHDGVRLSRAAALAGLIVATTLFLLPAPVPADLHGLVLPIALVPLWLVESGRPRGLPMRRESP